MRKLPDRFAVLAAAGLVFFSCSVPVREQAQSSGPPSAIEAASHVPSAATTPQSAAFQDPSTNANAPAQAPAARGNSGRMFSAADLAAMNVSRDSVLAKVGEKELRGSDLAASIFFHYPSQGADLLRKLVHDEIVSLEASRLHIEIEASDLDEAVHEALETLRKQVELEYAGKKTLDRFLETDLQTTLSRYESQLRRFVLARLLFERALRIEQAQEDRLVCRVLSAASKERATELLAKLREGADFESLAKLESLAPNREQGGKLPPFGRDYEHPIAALAFETPLGGLAGPLEEKRPNGESWFHVIRVIEKIPARIVDSLDAQREIRKGLLDRPIEEWEYLHWMRRMEKRYGVRYFERP